MKTMPGSENVQLGDSGQYLVDGKLVNKDGEPIKKKQPCKDCADCTCPTTQPVDPDEWHH